ncbi:phosphopantetheine adenylyltransferase [Roseibium limicola]|uniref:Phosphopantetheine adenylyltransferase n=1 Tax=Roseibium limicola TaxID=2816037 RepID=A0A939J8J0_9HYPH|nr:phosphopantetheine adenylyltransferase [Roseibium limicola]MBO0344408.1 phosphopantetheine adenylyltransferase [Roseibium limicola]
MTSINTYENDPFLEKFGTDVFRSNVRAMRPTTATHIAGVTIAACAAVVMATAIALNPFTAESSNASPAETQGAIATKSDRVVASSNVCDGQAWGAYSADCAASLSGQTNVRAVNFRTVEKPAGNNTTVLARVPSNG